MEWSSDLCAKLIAAVEDKEVLWNIQHHSYKDRNLREIAWETVATNLEIPKKEVADKWRLLRQQFRVSTFLFISVYYKFEISVVFSVEWCIKFSV